MDTDLRNIIAMVLRPAAGLLVLLLLFVVAQNNYLLYRTLLEGFSLVVAALIYVLTTRTYKYSGNTLLLFLGNVYLFIAVIEFFHIVTYKGMGIFPVQGTNTA